MPFSIYRSMYESQTMCGADLSDIYEEDEDDLKKEKKDSERKGTGSEQAFNIHKDHSDNVP